ncbi:MAG TPA: hypothetical protein GXX28_07040 [Firmicutes bacterium]|nr:hypothetical protein [Bacillota bacterium]
MRNMILCVALAVAAGSVWVALYWRGQTILLRRGIQHLLSEFERRGGND